MRRSRFYLWMDIHHMSFVSFKHLLERSRQPAAPDRPAFALMSVLGDADLE